MVRYLFVVFLLVSATLFAQIHHPPNHPYNNGNQYFSFTNANIVVAPNKIIKNGSLIIKDGIIVDVLNKKHVPNGALEIDLNQKYIYPSFIESYSNFGIQKKSEPTNLSSSTQQLKSNKKGYYWNEHIQPEQEAHNLIQFNEGDAKTLRSVGFGTINTHQSDGIARGTATTVCLQNKNISIQKIKEKSSNHFALKRGSSKQSYPTSLMGTLALLRQFYADASWYKNKTPKEKDASLEAYIKNQNLPEIIETNSKLDISRVLKINPNYIILGNGDEYEAIDEIVAQKPKLIVPLKFSKAYDVSNPFLALNVSLSQLRDWHQKPSNLSVLAKNNQEFALTTYGLTPQSDLLKNIQKSMKYGLEEQTILASLTTIPAKYLGLESKVGTLEKGKWANFLITNGKLFQKDSKILDNWVQGIQYKINSFSGLEAGKYALNIESKETITLEIQNKNGQLSAKSDSAPVKISENNKDLEILFKDKNLGDYRMIGTLRANDSAIGKATNYKGRIYDFKLNKTDEIDSVTKDSIEKNETKEIPSITYPNVAFGWKEKPKEKTYLIKNATVWTMESEGVLQQTDVLIKDGKIKKIGKNLKHSSAIEINGSRMHLTPGIIDEHSHMAIERGVNEAGQNSTAEVKIGDVLNPEDVNIFRQLAGGVTTSQLLHGSANPIGGQSQIIKLRWGASAEELKFENAPRFIKFALGENVKQSNWGIANPTRYPQTRMGVEQLFYDSFYRAKKYSLNKAENKRKDYELEALSDILNQKLFITCHSYVQSEILMLMDVADSLGFKINTFTHILEGYKLADRMKKHGVAGSTFSDWWAYKFEVNDAIPYNASLMNEMGVLTGINSDDREMARRLNQEAAKSMKYGNTSEIDALKMVTLNPAKMLKIDDKVGSIKVGKDADLVLWNHPPLSQYARAQKTFVDGILYFDRDQYQQQLRNIQEEKNKLIQLMINDDTPKNERKPPVKKEEVHYHCNTLESEFINSLN